MSTLSPPFATSPSPITLPIEVLAMVFEAAAAQDLPSVLLGNFTLYTLGARSLYRHITSRTNARRYILLLRTLASASTSRRCLHRLPNPALSVRRLRIDFHPNSVNGNLLRLIRDALKETRNLVDLELDFGLTAGYAPTAWCLRGMSSRLVHLHTSSAVDDTLVSWLNAENQRSITTLSLRGHPLYTEASLSADALPALTTFRSVHLRAQHIAAFVRGRPVENAAVTLFPLGCLEELDALKLASIPLKRTTLLCLEEGTIESLVPALAMRFPLLDGLHIVTISHVSIDHLKGITPMLHDFSRLRHVTFMAPDSARLSSAQEGEVVREWAAACTTLATVILTGGVVWYPEPKSGKWRSSLLEPL